MEVPFLELPFTGDFEDDNDAHEANIRALIQWVKDVREVLK